MPGSGREEPIALTGRSGSGPVQARGSRVADAEGAAVGRLAGR